MQGVFSQRCGIFLAVLAGLALLTSGCGKDSDRSKPVTKEGRIKTIDKERGVYEMMYYHPKEQKEILISGKLDPDVEIIVMGAVADLDDVEVDDVARVTGIAIGKSDEIPTFLVKKVEVIKKGIELPSPATATATGN